MKDGVNYSINTDDPVVLGNTLTDDYKFAQDMGLTDEDIIRGVSIKGELLSAPHAFMAKQCLKVQIF